MNEPAVLKCMFCRNTWKPTGDSDGTTDLADSLMKLSTPGIARGYVCDQCNTYVCEQCYLKNGRKCFCGNSNCSSLFVRGLSQEAQFDHRFAQSKLTGDVLFPTVAMLAMGFVCPQVNPSLPKATAITIGIVTAFVIAADGFRHKHAVSLHDRKQRMVFGARLGAAFGIGLGIMMAWGGGLVTGGVGGLGFIPWIVGGAIVWGLLTGLAGSSVSYSKK